jgi:2-dehydropantoate 2-reductase
LSPTLAIVNEAAAMRFVIFGAGGIGGTIGARLFVAGEAVALIARGAHLHAITDAGLKLITPAGERQLAIPACGHPDQHAWSERDVVLLCVKSQHTIAALDSLRGAAGDRVPVVCVQNGVANEAKALRRFENVYAMVVSLPAAHLSPGVVVTYAEQPGGVLDVGRYPGGTDARCEAIAQALTRAGFSSVPDPKVMRQKYAKLLMNLNNALQAASDMGDGVREIAAMLRDEALACYAAAGIAWAGADEVKARRSDGLRYVEIPGHPRHGGSSWQSIARGTGDIETDYLNGEIVLLGRLHDIATPANLVLQRLGNEMARRRLAPGHFKVTEVRALIDAQRNATERQAGSVSRA